MWTLDEALALIRKMQPEIRRFNYHVALGGGVLNKGRSDKDLDLYFIPFSEEGPRANDLRDYLSEHFGGHIYNLGGPSVAEADVLLAYPDEPTWVEGRFTLRPGDRRIDVFIA